VLALAIGYAPGQAKSGKIFSLMNRGSEAVSGTDPVLAEAICAVHAAAGKV